MLLSMEPGANRRGRSEQEGRVLYDLMLQFTEE
jgi:hypothetical protein